MGRESKLTFICCCWWKDKWLGFIKLVKIDTAWFWNQFRTIRKQPSPLRVNEDHIRDHAFFFTPVKSNLFQGQT